MILIIPEMKRVPEGASMATRRAMYDDYCAQLRRLNPHCYNADGSIKTWWQALIGLWRKT